MTTKNIAWGIILFYFSVEALEIASRYADKVGDVKALGFGIMVAFGWFFLFKWAYENI